MRSAGQEPTRARYPDEAGFVQHGDGVRVYFEVYGHHADTVCLLPPVPMLTSRLWRAQIAYLARHFRVIVIDPRGNGRSDRPADPAGYSRAAHVADVVAVLDHTGTDGAMLASLSPRAALAMELAVEHPERVRAAVFITPQLWPTGSAPPVARAPEARHEAYARWNRDYLIDDYDGFIDWFARSLLPHPHSTRQLEELIAQAHETDGRTVAAALSGFRIYGREEALALAREIACPVLVTQNGGVAAFWPKETSGPLAQAARGRLHVFPRLGPAVEVRWPVAMNLALREFFESVRGGATRTAASFTL